MRCSMDSAFSFYCQEINQINIKKSKQTHKQKIKIKRFICQNHVTIYCAQFQKVMAPSQGGQPEEVNFSKSSENRLPALKAIHKTTDKNRFSVIECTIQPQSFPDSLCAHECVFVVEEQKPHVFFRPCLVTAFQISICVKRVTK